MQQLKKSITSSKYTFYLLGVLIFIIAWFFISLAVDDHQMIFPDPISTFKATFDLLGKEYLYSCIGNSMLRMLIGFSIALVLAMVFGILAGNHWQVKKTLSPIMTILKSIPTATLVFLFLVVMGARNAPILMVTLISFPILYEAIAGGIENIDSSILKAAKIDSSSYFKTITRIELPIIFPYIMIGVASSFSLAFKIEIMAEVIAGDTRNGLGAAINAMQKTNPTDMTPIFAYSLIAIVVVFILSFLLYLVEKHFKLKTRK